MAIAESQLDTWAKQGPKQQFVDTYNSIKAVLKDTNSPYHGKRPFDAHLQGSYGNDTNVYGDSDVDIVICTDQTFNYDLEHLPPDQKEIFEKVTNKVPSTVNEFRQEVMAWLSQRYGSGAVQPGKKALLLQGTQNRRSADILVCTEHRQYFRFRSHGDDDHYKGVQFYATDGTSIINFPKQHAENCTAKHQATNSRFKPTIRIFKNMRNRMIDKRIIADGVAPSYYIEGMLWNVPNPTFGVSFQSTVADCLNWVHNAKGTDLLCPNQRRWLVRDGRPDAWPTGNFNTFITEAIKFWNAGG